MHWLERNIAIFFIYLRLIFLGWALLLLVPLHDTNLFEQPFVHQHVFVVHWPSNQVYLLLALLARGHQVLIRVKAFIFDRAASLLVIFEVSRALVDLLELVLLQFLKLG